VLDDDELMRKGRCGAFSDAEDFELVACGPTGDVVQHSQTWGPVDVVVVAAYHGSASFDRFVGVEAVDQLRRTDDPPSIFVIGLAAENPFLEVRLAEAGADHLYLRDEVATIDGLVDAVRRPDVDHEPRSSAKSMIPGLNGPTGLNRLLRRLEGLDLHEAFHPGLSQAETGLSRRKAINARHLVHETAKLDSATHNRTGGMYDRGFVPTWREVVEFVNRARGHELRAALT
jgi:hypothetical protein